MSSKIYTLKVERQVYSVSDLTKDIRTKLEYSFSEVWVEGEISNFKLHTSGHMYFSLKDEGAQIQCVMFRRENGRLDFEPAEGLKTLCFGRVSVYPVRGQYQLYVERIEPKGLGVLQLKFQQLVEKLKNEGLFDEERKKAIPFLPKAIALVTSIDGAALRDILQILERRYSQAHILIYPVPVQGVGSAETIAEAIRDLNRWQIADVMIVGRGGGSLEDLWAFNEEVVARAIYESDIPVISAVGHEVDYTIADFVSDLRAPTPSAAAEMVLPLRQELIEKVEDLKYRMLGAMQASIESKQRELQYLKDNRALKNPLAIFEIQFQRLDEYSRALLSRVQAVLAINKERFLTQIGKLDALGPLATLKRGFSVSLVLPQEKVITTIKNVHVGDSVKTKLKDGYFVSQVKEIGK